MIEVYGGRDGMSSIELGARDVHLKNEWGSN